ncbi:hypothetical protein [Leptospira bouyouniensis]|uniref:hypothetical protein n=1 Tax=Leptospira bouyouniensis TaxID=2484911 RepID=UPI0010915B55|nr:hypothetical protein [Leptospira bouyouniensis]TGM80078.1 hypothetical protein EHQ99_10195 [Leptospira bouyouniensis]
MKTKNIWIHFGLCISLIVCFTFAIVLYFHSPNVNFMGKLGLLYYLIRYGHSFVWALIFVATSLVWIHLIQTGNLVVSKVVVLIYKLAGFVYILFILYSYF